LGIVHAFLPMQYFNEKCFKIGEKEENNEQFNDVFFKFESDYKRSNPVTARIAKENIF
jgi:hypothetical protein